MNIHQDPTKGKAQPSNPAVGPMDFAVKKDPIPNMPNANASTRNLPNRDSK